MRRAFGPVGLLGTALLVAFPVFRRWHLHWGATPEEVDAPMPGDDTIPRASFAPTRALTINAPPERVWPWLVQMGLGRAGFYSYDLLDNLGRASADRILPEWQSLAVGDVAAPMASPPTETTSFRVAGFEPGRWLLWEKPDSTWSWVLRPLAGGGTRLITRLRCRYDWRSPSILLSLPLMELGDFPMMRRCLLGIRQRAEAQPVG